MLKNKVAVFCFVVMFSGCMMIFWRENTNAITPLQVPDIKKESTGRSVKGLQGIEYRQSQDFFSRIIYNRVGKCGSRSMQAVISKLAKDKGYQFYISPTSNQTHPPILKVKSAVELISSIKPPMIYSRHIYYIHFARFGMPPPIYINMIRDPIERFCSQYHFKRNGDLRNPGKTRFKKLIDAKIRDLDINDCILGNYTECSEAKLWYIVPYFCGQDHMCLHPTTEALQKAKRHLLDNYLAVGFVEDFVGTLKLFERLMPFYFSGATQIWQEIANNTYTKTITFNKKALKPEVRAILRKRMALEYDFYYFASQVYRHLKAQVGLNTND